MTDRRTGVAVLKDLMVISTNGRYRAQIVGYVHVHRLVLWRSLTNGSWVAQTTRHRRPACQVPSTKSGPYRSCTSTRSTVSRGVTIAGPHVGPRRGDLHLCRKIEQEFTTSLGEQESC